MKHKSKRRLDNVRRLVAVPLVAASLSSLPAIAALPDISDAGQFRLSPIAVQFADIDGLRTSTFAGSDPRATFDRPGLVVAQLTDLNDGTGDDGTGDDGTGDDGTGDDGTGDDGTGDDGTGDDGTGDDGTGDDGTGDDGTGDDGTGDDGTGDDGTGDDGTGDDGTGDDGTGDDGTGDDGTGDDGTGDDGTGDDGTGDDGTGDDGTGDDGTGDDGTGDDGTGDDGTGDDGTGDDGTGDDGTGDDGTGDDGTGDNGDGAPSGGLVLTKSGTPDSVSSVGEPITYIFDIVNNTDVAQTNIVVDDPLLGGTVCTVGLLSPTFSATCTGIYFTTEADLNAGTVSNTATATSDQTLTPVEASFTLGDGNGGGGDSPLTLTKTVEPSSFSGAGEQLTYEFAVTNMGVDPQTNVTVTDPLLGGQVCEVGLLSPTFTAICTGIYFTTDADVAAGEINNTASAVSAENATPVEASATISTGGAPDLPIIFTKTANPISYSGAGEIITYEFRIANQGDEVLTNVVVTDPLLGGVVCESESLSPTFEIVCTGVYVTTGDDVVAGEVSNTATLTTNETLAGIDATTSITAAGGDDGAGDDGAGDDGAGDDGAGDDGAGDDGAGDDGAGDDGAGDDGAGDDGTGDDGAGDDGTGDDGTGDDGTGDDGTGDDGTGDDGTGDDGTGDDGTGDDGTGDDGTGDDGTGDDGTGDDGTGDDGTGDDGTGDDGTGDDGTGDDGTGDDGTGDDGTGDDGTGDDGTGDDGTGDDGTGDDVQISTINIR